METGLRRRVEKLERSGGPDSELARYWYDILVPLRAMRQAAEARRSNNWIPPDDQQLWREAQAMAATGRTFAEELRRAFVEMQAKRASAQHGRGEDGVRTGTPATEERR